MKYEPKVICPEVKKHTKCPEGYLQWHDWAEKKHNTGWRQRRCDGCGLFSIWYKPTKGVKYTS